MYNYLKMIKNPWSPWFIERYVSVIGLNTVSDVRFTSSAGCVAKYYIVEAIVYLTLSIDFP